MTGFKLIVVEDELEELNKKLNQKCYFWITDTNGAGIQIPLYNITEEDKISSNCEILERSCLRQAEQFENINCKWVVNMCVCNINIPDDKNITGDGGNSSPKV